MSANPYDHISDYVRFLTRMRPKSILDVGMGNGRLGYVARHLFNAMDGLGIMRCGFAWMGSIAR